MSKMKDLEIIENLKFIEIQKNSEGVSQIILSRPDQANALHLEMIEELVWSLEYLDLDSQTKVVLLGAKGKHFCAGGDVKDMYKREGMFKGDEHELALRYQYSIQKIPKTIEAMNTPLIAVIEGAAFGAGLDLACMCDMRVANSKAQFSENFVKIGLISGDGGPYFLTPLVGLSKALEMSLTGDVYTAKEALEMGLINYLNDDPKTLAMEIAMKMAKNPKVSLSLTRKVVRKSQSLDLHSYLELVSRYQGVAQHSKEHQEFLKTFQERKIK